MIGALAVQCVLYKSLFLKWLFIEDQGKQLGQNSIRGFVCDLIPSNGLGLGTESQMFSYSSFFLTQDYTA